MVLIVHVSSLPEVLKGMCSVLAKELKSGAPPLLSIAFSFDVVERLLIKNTSML